MYIRLKWLGAWVGFSVAIASVSGCGSGVGNNTILPTPAITNPFASTVTQSSVPPLTAGSSTVTNTPVSYKTGTPLLATYTATNSDRSSMGVGFLLESPALDAAAQAHAQYLAAQTPQIESHNETQGAPSFYAITPYARAMKAGFSPSTAWIDESIGDASNCAGQLMDTVYHLQELTSNAQQVGIGSVPGWACVIDVATVTGSANLVQPTNGAGVPTTGGQQLPAGVLGVYPYNGQSSVPDAMSLSEQPAPPLPSGYTNPGHPVLMRAGVVLSTDQLTVTSFTMVDSTKKVVTGVLLLDTVAAANSVSISSATVTLVADANIMQGVAVFVPQSALVSGMTYAVTFKGTMGAASLSNTWAFTAQ